MTEQLKVDKIIWTHEDYDRMNVFHDCIIFGMGLRDYGHGLMFDIDYLFHSPAPAQADGPVKMWISPATLIFTDVADIRVRDVHVDANTPWPSIMELTKTDMPAEREDTNNSSRLWQWTMKLDHGEIAFLASGYSMYLRSAPVLSDGQSLDIEWRGGVCFDHPSPPDHPGQARACGIDGRLR